MLQFLLEIGIANFTLIALRVLATIFTILIASGIICTPKPSGLQIIGVASIPVFYGAGESALRLRFLIDLLKSGDLFDTEPILDLIEQIQWLILYSLSVALVSCLVILVRQIRSKKPKSLLAS